MTPDAITTMLVIKEECLPMSLQSEILVVDDDAGIRMLMRCALEDRGYQVCTANSGHEALKIVLDRGRDLRLLITDVVMPGMNGPALAEVALQRFPGLPVLYVSGYLGDDYNRRPACAYLEKPFSVPQLLERVHALISPDTPGPQSQHAVDENSKNSTYIVVR